MIETDLIYYALAVFAAGMISGFISGLFGIGGGLITIPALYTILTMRGIAPDIAMHVAAGTSLLVIVPTSFMSFRAHYRHGKVDMCVLKLWAPFIILGALLGSSAGHALGGDITRNIFIAFMLLIAIYMGFFPSPAAQHVHVKPHNARHRMAAGFIGFFSSMIGVGGGVLAVPSMVALSLPIHSAVATSSALGFLIGIPASVVMMAAPVSGSGLPTGSVGYVNLWAFAFLVPATMMLAPIGARVAHKLNPLRLRRLFALLAIAIAAKMYLGG